MGKIIDRYYILWYINDVVEVNIEEDKDNGVFVRVSRSRHDTYNFMVHIVSANEYAEIPIKCCGEIKYIVVKDDDIINELLEWVEEILQAGILLAEEIEIEEY